LGRAWSPSNTLWPGPTSVPSFIVIHPTVWLQYTNVTERQTDRQTGQRSDRIGRTVLQTVVQKFHGSTRSRMGVRKSVGGPAPVQCCVVLPAVAWTLTITSCLEWPTVLGRPSTEPGRRRSRSSAAPRTRWPPSSRQVPAGDRSCSAAKATTEGIIIRPAAWSSALRRLV